MFENTKLRVVMRRVMEFGVLVLGFLAALVWGDGTRTAIPGASETDSEEGPTATYNPFVYPLLAFHVSLPCWY